MDVWHDDRDADEAAVCEGTDRGSASIEVPLKRARLGLDGMFATALRVPRERVRSDVSLDELTALLVEMHVDAFASVNLRNTRNLGPLQRSELDCACHLPDVCALTICLRHRQDMANGVSTEGTHITGTKRHRRRDRHI